jgi:hypothetical protein
VDSWRRGWRFVPERMLGYDQKVRRLADLDATGVE